MTDEQMYKEYYGRRVHVLVDARGIESILQSDRAISPRVVNIELVADLINELNGGLKLQHVEVLNPSPLNPNENSFSDPVAFGKFIRASVDMRYVIGVFEEYKDVDEAWPYDPNRRDEVGV